MRRKNKFTGQTSIRWLAVACFALLAPYDVRADEARPGFDCGKAKTKQEKFICSHPQWAALDGQVSQIYAGLLQEHPQLAKAIRDNQRAWLRGIHDPRFTAKEEWTKPLLKAYQDRIAEMESKEFLVSDWQKLPDRKLIFRYYAINSNSGLMLQLNGKIKDLDVQFYQLEVIKKGVVVQTLRTDSDFPRLFDPQTLETSDWIKINLLRLQDVDYDGYDDIMLLDAMGVTGNHSYIFFFFNPQNAMFQPTGKADRIFTIQDIQFDRRAQTISVAYQNSEHEWDWIVYGWRQGKLKALNKKMPGNHYFSEIPLLDEDAKNDHQFAGQVTFIYNKNEQLIRADFAPNSDLTPKDSYCDECCSDLPDMLRRLRKPHSGYRLDITDDTHFSMIYDPPVSGEAAGLQGN